MKRILIVTAFLRRQTPASMFGQGTANITSAEPFKLGTFEIDGEARIGIVLQDKLVVDLKRQTAPSNAILLIGDFHAGRDARPHRPVRVRHEGPVYGSSKTSSPVSASWRPHDRVTSRCRSGACVGALDARKILNAAVISTATSRRRNAEEQRKAAAERKASAAVPYLS